jgi:hypothetical protein
VFATTISPREVRIGEKARKSWYSSGPSSTPIVRIGAGSTRHASPFPHTGAVLSTIWMPALSRTE